jgi:alkanesulfonate monooxygenase SsuD/methylene tetrahydromethanopterin reductase-like flavin-dependent oxidoreductase (luciferase family)
MTRTRPLRKLGFAHLVPLDPSDPARSLEEALQLFEYAESVGLDSGWVRTRHLQRALPAAAPFLAAASQRTTRLELGNATIPVGYENPFRLAEDLSVVDQLSGGRLQPALSVHPPQYDDDVAALVHGDGFRAEDYGYGRIDRVLSFLRGEPVRPLPEAPERAAVPSLESDRVEPHSPGLADRIWYGGGSLKSAEWAGRTGLNWLVSNITSAEDGVTDFAQAQRRQIDRFRAHHPLGESALVGQGHVVVPTDGATPAQAARYREYVERRTPRTQSVQGRGTLIAKDAFGSLDDLLEYFDNDIAFQAADEFVFELPFEFEFDDYLHIIRELATRVGPALGWTPASA